MNVDEYVRIAELMDAYGRMLTEHQRNIVEQYACEDCSLFEIAEREGISRQGVRDAIKRAQSKLEEIDSVLDYVNKSALTRERLKKISEAVNGGCDMEEVCEQLKLLNDIWKFIDEEELKTNGV